MTTFIKTKFKKSDDQTNIDKYILTAYITEYHIISKLFFLTHCSKIQEGKAIISLKIYVHKNVEINMFKWTF